MCTKALIEILGVVLSFEVTILAISGCFSWALEPGLFKITMFLVALISCFLNTVFFKARKNKKIVMRKVMFVMSKPS